MMAPKSTVEIIMIMITATVCFILISASVVPAITGKPLSETKAKMLVGMVGSLIAIISMHIGRKGGGR